MQSFSPQKERYQGHSHLSTLFGSFSVIFQSESCSFLSVLCLMRGPSKGAFIYTSSLSVLLTRLWQVCPQQYTSKFICEAYFLFVCVRS